MQQLYVISYYASVMPNIIWTEKDIYFSGSAYAKKLATRTNERICCVILTSRGNRETVHRFFHPTTQAGSLSLVQPITK